MNKLTVSVGQLIDNNRSRPAQIRRRELLNGFKSYVVYIVRDDQKIIYIGSTNYNAEIRIRQHITGKSDLGIRIRQHYPESMGWTVEMIKCDKHELRQKEKFLIHELNPEINRRRK